jgi:O-antigen ligase
MLTKDKGLLLIVLLFIGTLFFPFFPVVSLIITVVLVLAALFYNSLGEKKNLIRQRPHVWFMFAFFLWILISILLSDNTNRGFRYLDSRLPLGYFPLSIGLIYLRKYFRDRILFAIALLITAVAITCFAYGVYRSVTLHDSSLLYNDSLTVPVTGQQSIYISLLVNIAIYIFVYFLFFKDNLQYKAAVLGGVLILFVINFFLASRNMMLVLYVFTLAFACWYVITRRKYVEGGILVIGILMGGFAIVKFAPKTINRFKELTYTKFDYQQTGPESHYNMAVDTGQWNGANTRLAIWGCGWELFKQNPVMGVGLGDKKDELIRVYEKKNFEFAIRTQKNVHNNYLDILVSMGIVGFMLFLIAWVILPLRAAWINKDILSVLIVLTLALAMLTENYFDRALGGALVGFFGCFLFVGNRGV